MPLQVVNSFNLANIHEEKRKKFVENIIKNKINTDNIFFTGEFIVVLRPKLNKQNNFIRYSKEERINRWNPEIQKKRANETQKFKQSLMITGGICKYLPNLVIKIISLFSF